MSGDPLEAQTDIVGKGEARTKHTRGTQAKTYKGAEERTERADWESVRKRTDWNLQVIKWLVHQARPCLSAKVSAVKLEAIGPAEIDKEFDVLHLEHTLQRHRDQKGRGQIRQSILGYQMGGGRIGPLEAIWSRDVLLPEQSGMKGETLKWVVDHGEKGGT